MLAEIGVYRGNTACVIANFARLLGVNAYLFDTFEGFHKNDLRGLDNNIETQFQDTDLERVRSLVGDTNVNYIKGYFPKSTKHLSGDEVFCLVHIDCDLYMPILNALQYFYPKVVEGGYIMIHDYSSLHWDGAETAVDQFFCDKPESILPVPDASGTVIVRKFRRSDKYNNWYVRRIYDISVNSWVGPEHLHQFLDAGWSNVEPWGIWGIGPSHCMRVIIPFPIHKQVKSAHLIPTSCSRGPASIK